MRRGRPCRSSVRASRVLRGADGAGRTLLPARARCTARGRRAVGGWRRLRRWHHAEDGLPAFHGGRKLVTAAAERDTALRLRPNRGGPPPEGVETETHCKHASHCCRREDNEPHCPIRCSVGGERWGPAACSDVEAAGREPEGVCQVEGLRHPDPQRQGKKGLHEHHGSQQPTCPNPSWHTPVKAGQHLGSLATDKDKVEC
mmetsp:Transcript_109960/g.328754  ORF Transcript_109960/g.328754 Transcript_109960/m.328754 type:complete len:201 (-) Transcript_109960:242-844(-)